MLSSTYRSDSELSDGPFMLDNISLLLDALCVLVITSLLHCIHQKLRNWLSYSTARHKLRVYISSSPASIFDNVQAISPNARPGVQMGVCASDYDLRFDSFRGLRRSHPFTSLRVFTIQQSGSQRFLRFPVPPRF